MWCRDWLACDGYAVYYKDAIAVSGTDVNGLTAVTNPSKCSCSQHFTQHENKQTPCYMQAVLSKDCLLRAAFDPQRHGVERTYATKGRKEGSHGIVSQSSSPSRQLIRLLIQSDP